MEKSKSGQILLSILLVMGVALTVGLAMSVRSWTGLRRSINTQDAVVCQNRIDAGIDDALAKLAGDLANLPLCDISGVRSGVWKDPDQPADSNIVVCDLDNDSCGSVDRLETPEADVATCVAKENERSEWTDLAAHEAVQVILRTADEPVPNLTNVDISWKPTISGGSQPILEATIIGKNRATGEATKFYYSAFDPKANDSCDLGGVATMDLNADGYYSINLPIPEQGTYSGYDFVLRIRFLCSGVSKMMVTGRGINPTELLPTQYFMIRSVCLNLPVFKEIEAVKTKNFLPGIMDFNLFSGSSTETLGGD